MIAQCGHTVNAGGRYCGHCGKFALLPVANTKDGKCKDCGKKWLAGWKFCGYCGSNSYEAPKRLVIMQCPTCGKTSRNNIRCDEVGCDGIFRMNAIVTRERADGTTEDWEILKLLGQGGMGAVYKARRVEDGLIVVVKEARPQSIDPASPPPIDPEVPHDNEAAVMAVLKGRAASYPQSYGYFEFDGSHLLLMDFVDGKTLEDICKERMEDPRGGDTGNRFDTRYVWQMMRAIAEAADQAHKLEIVLRDLKPGNVMIENRTGVLMIIDLGFARILSRPEPFQGMGIGTFGYAPAEQWGMGYYKSDPSVHWDIHAIGAIAWYMLTGVKPQTLGQQPSFSMHKVPYPMSTVLEKCLADNPARRPQSVAELLGLLDDYYDSL